MVYQLVLSFLTLIRKAFDSVPHSLLLEKLWQYDFPPMIVNWITCYLSDRLQRTVMNGSQSSFFRVLSGVPQGSILGPLLFILYMDQISSVPTHSTLILYADDILLFSPVNSISELQLFQEDVNSVANWVRSQKLTLNINKTKWMFVSRRRSSLPFNLQVTMAKTWRECMSTSILELF